MHRKNEFAFKSIFKYESIIEESVKSFISTYFSEKLRIK